jgi:hypothetical protein
MEVRMRRVALTLTILVSMCPLTARAEESLQPHPESAPATPLRYRAPHVVVYEGGRIPSHAHLEERANTKLVGAGIALTGTLYGLSLLYALGTCGAQMECRNGSAWLYVPIVGPFFTAGRAPTTGGAALSAFDGALQTVGLAVFIAGLALPKQVVVWQDEDVAIRVAPAPVAGGAGLVLSLTHL